LCLYTIMQVAFHHSIALKCCALPLVYSSEHHNMHLLLLCGVARRF
jgi:hypothetical protein